jgi:hypothetical protein
MFCTLRFFRSRPPLPIRGRTLQNNSGKSVHHSSTTPNPSEPDNVLRWMIFGGGAAFGWSVRDKFAQLERPKRCN